MQVNFTTILLTLLVSLIFKFTQAQDNAADKAAIQSIIQEETNTWNKGDAEGYSKHFAKDGTFTNILGMFFTGQEEFEKRHEQIFTGMFRGTTMKQNIISLKFVRPDVAIIETVTYTSGFSKAGLPPGMLLDSKGRLRTRLLQVLVKEGNNWKIITYHNVDVQPTVAIPEP